MFHSVDDGDDGADKHVTHLSQAADCSLTEKSKQNEHVAWDKDNDVDDGVDNGDDDSVDNGDDDGDDNGDDNADKHLTHLSEAADCCLMERSEQNKHVVCNVDDGLEDGDDDCVDNGDDNGVDNGDDGVDKHLTHISQAADCCLMERSKQNKHVVCNKEDNFDDGVDNGDDDSVKDGDDDGVDNGDDSADKHLTPLSQAAHCCLTERSKQNKH
eukprot:10847642-Ditylum_brightwellii.AAC.1